MFFDIGQFFLSAFFLKDGSTDGLKILPPLFVHKENGDYTDEIFEIYFGKKTEGES